MNIGDKFNYPKGKSDKHPNGLPVIVKEIRESMSGEKVPYVERQDGSGQCFTCPMEDLTSTV